MMKERVVFLADCQSFYASVEISDNPLLKGKPVIVSGDPERRSGIILAACPLAKSFGVTTAEPLWQALSKCPHAVVIRPRMERYLKVSLFINDIYKRYTDLVQPYSIDETFLDMTRSMHLFGGDAVAIAKQIQQEVMAFTGVYVRIGIGSNKILAKMACDNFAKKNKSGIFLLTHDNMKTDLWPLPVRKMFGVGSRYERHLFNMGIRTIGDLANTPIERLKRRWGINGMVLSHIANGIDFSPVSSSVGFSDQKGIGHQMTLPRDYCDAEEIKCVLLELTEEVCRKARKHHVVGRTVSVGCGGADFDYPAGFYRQTQLDEESNATMEVFPTAWKLFLKHWDRQPVRSVGVTLSGLSEDTGFQMNLFQDKEKQRKIDRVMDIIKDRFGTTAIVRAVSLTKAGQAFDRAHKIGGHYK